ncbi:MAG: sigma-70 family RNA polymerase sigma factor [Acidithiobacillus sp.]|uniref:sigma-70 family RNA polymerase sigma factor n=1 Tax=Acidithiobacillus ferrooxidans TaxID=920 RepID=UPI0013D37CA7|nr:sigma-70 family RNA polymerase sigma factor [Acidithiobacillus ferrooxidans]
MTRATAKNSRCAESTKASRSVADFKSAECTSARDALVLQYLPLAYAMARRISLPFEDAAQEAIIGLIRAADHFDDTRNTAFSTYARYWITEALQRAAIQALPVHVPLHVAKRAAAARRSAAGMAAASMAVATANPCFTDDIPTDRVDGSLADGGLADGRLADCDFAGGSPANETFTDESGLPDFQAVDVQPSGRMPGKRRGGHRVGYAFAMSNVHPVRVEMEYEDGEPRHEAVSAQNPWDEKETRMDADRVKAHLQRLTVRQRNAMMLYYGIGGRDGCTLDEAGSIMGISREAVRQLIARGVDMLREFAQVS